MLWTVALLMFTVPLQTFSFKTYTNVPLVPTLQICFIFSLNGHFTNDVVKLLGVQSHSATLFICSTLLKSLSFITASVLPIFL